MANEVTISVGAKTNDAAIKQASVNVLEVFGKALKGLENIGGQSAKTVKKELESIKGAFSSKDLTKEAKAHFEELAKSLNALVKVNDVTGEIEVSFQKVHEKIGEAAKKSEELSKHVKKIEEDLPSGSAKGEMTSGIENLNGEFATMMSQVKSISKSIKSFGRGFMMAGGGLKAAGLVAGVAAIGMAVMKAIKAWRDYSREAKVAVMETENRRIEHSLEIQNKKLQTKVELQNMARENAQAELKATQDLVVATADLEAARKRAGAFSAGEKNEIENELNKIKNKVQGEALLADMDNREKADKEKLEQLTEELEMEKKKEETAQENAGKYGRIAGEFYHGSSIDLALRGASAAEIAARNLGSKSELVESPTEKSQMFTSFDSKKNDELKKVADAQAEQAKKAKEIEIIQSRLADGKYYAKQREEIKKKIELLKEEQRIREIEQERERQLMNTARAEEKWDRQTELEDAIREEEIRRLETTGGYAGQLGAVEERTIASKQRAKDAENRFEEYTQEEIVRLKGQLIESIKKRNPGIKDEDITDEDIRQEFNILSDDKKSDLWRQQRSKYESIAHREALTQQQLEARKWDINFQGDEKTAELRAQSLKGGSRLTAMGLGGGDSPQKETAKNTRLMVGALNKVVSLLEPGELKFDKNPKTGKWGML